jgi:protein tyrosine phosphatase (PTP) superfamily phosphohydrolase (DUF442 family)
MTIPIFVLRKPMARGHCFLEEAMPDHMMGLVATMELGRESRGSRDGQGHQKEFPMRPVALALLSALCGGLVAQDAVREQRQATPGLAPVQLQSVSQSDPAKVEAAGLHNVYRLTGRLYSGNSPDGETGFRSLKKLGVRTVISVDGAKPEVALARKYGLRYVHIPIGYDGITREQALRIAKAARDLPGPVYIHCHHGKHRGPAAAAVVRLCLDSKCSVDTVLSEMKRAGTDPRYTGLYAAPRKLQRPTAKELDRLPADFPETAKVAALAEVMVGIDQNWDNLKQLQGNGWKISKDHPDLDPPNEALQLLEHYREAKRLDSVQQRSKAFRRRLAEAEDAAEELEKVLRFKRGKEVKDVSGIDKVFGEASKACTRCHADYRDIPQSLPGKGPQESRRPQN